MFRFPWRAGACLLILVLTLRAAELPRGLDPDANALIESLVIGLFRKLPPVAAITTNCLPPFPAYVIGVACAEAGSL